MAMYCDYGGIIMVKTVDEAISKYYPECLDVYALRNERVFDFFLGIMAVRGATEEEFDAVIEDWEENWHA